jgi:hypothetical protein
MACLGIIERKATLLYWSKVYAVVTCSLHLNLPISGQIKSRNSTKDAAKSRDTIGYSVFKSVCLC